MTTGGSAGLNGDNLGSTRIAEFAEQQVNQTFSYDSVPSAKITIE